MSYKIIIINNISPNNKSIIKPFILNQPNIRSIKQQKKAIRDSRRKISEDEKMKDTEELSDFDEIIIDEPSTSNKNENKNENKSENKNLNKNLYKIKIKI